MNKATRREKIQRDRERESAKLGRTGARIYPDPVFDPADHIDY